MKKQDPDLSIKNNPRSCYYKKTFQLLFRQSCFKMERKGKRGQRTIRI